MTEALNDAYTFQAEGNHLHIAIHTKDWDAAHVASFKAALDANWSDGVDAVTIDMVSVEFIDSSGIGALLSVHKKFDQAHKLITLKNTHPSVVSVIELLRLHRVFEINPETA